MNIKRIISLAAVASLSMAMLASCGSNDESSTSEKKDNSSTAEAVVERIDGKGATIKVLTNRTDRLSQGGDGSMEERTKAFEEAFNCKVEYTGFTNYADDVSKMMTTKDYGDVLAIPDSVELKDLGNFFEPLGTYDELKETYRWVDKKMYDKTVYGIATGGTATGILYNTKVWADAGITELPKTPEEFLEDLQKIKDKGEAIPYYTQFADASWTIGQWSNLILSASGDPNYNTGLLQNKNDLFAEDGGYYKVFKLMYDVFSNKDVIEEDPTTTQWEASKEWMADGKIGTMVMGSWAISQFEEKAAGHEEDIGYMPAPFTVDGKQYAQTSADYCLGVNKNSENIELAKKYVEWFALESGYAFDEGMIPPAANSELPNNLGNFKDCVLFEEELAPDELQGKFNEVDKGSEVGTFDGDAANFKIKLAEAAFAGKGEEGFKAIIEDCNKRWAETRDSVIK